MDDRAIFEPNVIGPPPRRWVWVVGLLVALALVVAGTTIPLLIALRMVGLGPYAVPSVDRLAANYRAHRGDFRALAELSSQDATFGIDVRRRGVLGHGISNSAAKPFEAPMRAVGAKNLTFGGGDLEVLLGQEGLAVSGVDWGDGHYSSPPSDVVSIDVARNRDAPELWFYPLGDGWYAMVNRFQSSHVVSGTRNNH
jgi:hypothetical protein